MAATAAEHATDSAVIRPSALRRAGAAVGLLVFAVGGGVVLAALATVLAAAGVVLLIRGLG